MLPTSCYETPLEIDLLSFIWTQHISSLNCIFFRSLFFRWNIYKQRNESDVIITYAIPFLVSRLPFFSTPPRIWVYILLILSLFFFLILFSSCHELKKKQTYPAAHSMAQPTQLDPFSEVRRDSDAGAAFVLESKGHLNSRIRILLTFFCK